MTDYFFVPGAEYDDATGYSAPETIRTFRCEHVAVTPDTGEPIAFGFMHSIALGWGGTGMGVSHWRQGWNRTSPTPERKPSEGLKALAEAGERERDRQAAMNAAMAHETLEKASPSEVAARLREHGLTEAADFLESVKPVVARENVVNMGEPREVPAETHVITTWKSHPMIGEYWQAMCSCGGGVTMLYRTSEAARAAAEDHEPGEPARDGDAAEA